MQIECAKTFQKDTVVSKMSEKNKEQLVDETLNFILNANLEHEEVRFIDLIDI